MNTKHITKKLTSFAQRIRHGYSGEPNPGRDWNTILLSTLILLLVSVAVNAFFFLQVYDGEPLSKEIDTNPPARETEAITESLTEVEEIFDAREAARQNFLNTTYPFVDPARN